MACTTLPHLTRPLPPSYDSNVPALTAARFKARAWAHNYNHTFPSDPNVANFDALAAHRMTLLRSILGHVGTK